MSTITGKPVSELGKMVYWKSFFFLHEYSQKVNYKYKAVGGPGLSFIVYPEALSLMPL